MIRTKDIMASLPLVASVLGDRYGVKVNIGGDQAYTDGNNINLPTLPLDCDAELLALAKGFVDHEAAHIRHTDFAALRTAQLTPVQKHLWNTLEDWMVENKLAALFPGCRQHFRWLIQHHFGHPVGKESSKAGDSNTVTKPPSLSILNWILLTVRAWDVPEIAVQRDAEATAVDTAYPGLRTELEVILSRVRQQCQGTSEAIAYALELSAVIEAYSQNSMPEQKTGQKGSQTDTAMENMEEDSSDFVPQSDKTGQSTAQQELHALLHASAETLATHLPRNIGEHLAETLNAQKVEHHGQGMAVAQNGHKFVTVMLEEAREQSLRNSVALRTRLHGLLQAITRQPCIMGRRGKLCPERLHGLAVHNPRIFLKHGEKRQTFTAVHLLVDCSGSMSGSRMELASLACYAVALALEQCRGVNAGVSAFPGSDSHMGVTVAPILRHGERVHHRFSMSAVGYTPLAEALWWVIQQMYPLKEERKIILILSDGSPDSVPAAIHALKQAKGLGFEVMGLGIQDNSMDTLLSPMNMPTRTIHKLAELAPAMFGMLQQALLRQGGPA